MREPESLRYGPLDPEHHDCDTCNGTGRVPCPNRGCTGGTVLAGLLVCSVCNGEGDIECEDCGGTGEEAPREPEYEPGE